MDLPCCKSLKLAALSLKRDLLATQRLIKSFANNDRREYALFYDDLRYSFSNFFFFTFFCENTSLTVFTDSQQKSYQFEHFFLMMAIWQILGWIQTNFFGKF